MRVIVLRRWRIWLSEDAAATVVAAAREHHPVEIGGVLVGVAVGGRPWVTEAVVVPSEKQTPTYYELPVGARHAVIDEARKRDTRLGYVGDWHAHPADVGPSGTDLTTMRALSDRDADCSRPVLIIARRAGAAYRLDPRQFTGRRLRELRVIAAGALPLAEEKRMTRSRGARPKRRVASWRDGH